MKALVLSLTTLLLTIGATAGAPHQEGQSYIFLRIYDDFIEGRVEILYRDLRRALRLPEAGTGELTGQYLEEHAGKIKSYVEDRLGIRIGGIAADLETTRLSVFDAPFGTFVLVHFKLPKGIGRPDVIEVHYNGIFDIDPDHRAFVVVEHDWRKGTFANESGGALLLTPDHTTRTVDLTGGSLFAGFAAMVGLGIWHIWIGIDHILFLLALLLPAVLRREGGRWLPVERFRTSLWNVVAIVSMFTIAHTVTLSLAALDVVRLSPQIVESVIAASIILVALHNIYPVIPERDWVIAFVFGLFHGFGFASVLGYLGVGSEHAVLSLFGFNLGVEIGQIAVVCMAFPLLYLARTRRWYPRLLRVGSWCLIAVASIWFVERAFDIPMSRVLRRAVRRAGRLVGF